MQPPLLDTPAPASLETGDLKRAVHFQNSKREVIGLPGGKLPELDATLKKYKTGAQ